VIHPALEAHYFGLYVARETDYFDGLRLGAGETEFGFLGYGGEGYIRGKESEGGGCYTITCLLFDDGQDLCRYYGGDGGCAREGEVIVSGNAAFVDSMYEGGRASFSL
jgi:hypothetical protein